ncbi:DUF5336 domain-containing protein [Mycobacterium asiaticum]|nr:DUF5336 domain-containing protein [Mycobacterium asiaticum]
MSYPGNQGYYAADQSSGWTGSDSYWSSEPESGSKMSHRHLTLAVVVLGACAYLVSFGPMVKTAGIGWEVRLAALAGLLAAFGLLPRQIPAGKIVAALAALGFLDALSSVLVVPDGIQPGWASWVVVVVNGLQTAAAVGALLAQPSATADQQAWYAAWYAASAEQYAQAAAQYYGQYPDRGQAESGYATGDAHTQHEAHHVAVAEARGAAESQEASYSEFIGQNAGAQPGPVPGVHSAQPSATPGFGEPNAGHAPVPAQQQPAVSQPEHRVSN